MSWAINYIIIIIITIIIILILIISSKILFDSCDFPPRCLDQPVPIDHVDLKKMLMLFNTIISLYQQPVLRQILVIIAVIYCFIQTI